MPDLKYTQIGSRRASSIAVAARLHRSPLPVPELPGPLDGLPRQRQQPTQHRGRRIRRLVSPRELPRELPGLAAGAARAGIPAPARRRRWGHWEAGQRGAILYRDRDGQGPRAFFDRDVPDLDRTRFGSRMASSIDVSPGCIVTLYELPGYRGRRTDFRERDNNLKNTPVGEDTVSSLKVRCR